MSQVTDQKSFQLALAALSLAEQRQIGARFIEHVLDLSREPRFDSAIRTAGKPDVSPEELDAAYPSVHALYVQTHPRSDLSTLDYHQQAVHFIAEACLMCLASASVGKPPHLAEKVAMYCRMARVCANIPHEQEYPSFEQAEQAMHAETRAQYGIVEEHLRGH